MTRVPSISVRYAYDTPYGHGPTWETPEEARAQQPDAEDAGHELHKVYVNEQHKIIHSEVIA